MSRSTVDEQVVKMSFDNSNFDSNIDSSIKTLNQLDSRLVKLDKSNLNNLTNSVNNFSNVLSAKGQIMLGFFTRLGNELYNLGKKTISKIFEGPSAGYREYETLIGATQTIFENVKQDGKSIDDVNAALDELNDYADKTIYNFTEMTRTIGMFTSAGVNLNKSVNTIKGLANAAALVGANTQKAEMAWRAVSRAMSTGKFTNLTWKTLEMSNIAGKQFQTVIKEVARVNKVTDKHGRNIDKMIKKYGSLRESLKEGWLTKDIFNQAMEIMAGDMSEADLKKKGYSKKQIEELMKIAESAKEAATRVKTFGQLVETTKEAIGSGWTESFRIIVGNLEQARKLYTSISQTLNEFIDNNARIRNKLLKDIFDFGATGNTGRDDLDKILKNMLASVISFIKAVKTGFLNIFPIDRIASGFRSVLKTVEKFTRMFVLNAEEVDKNGNRFWNTKDIDKMSNSIENLIRFFRGLASVLDIVWMAISQPIKVIIERIPFLNNFFNNASKGINGIVSGLGKFGDKITVFRNAVKDTNLFGAALEYVFNNFDELVEKSPLLSVITSIFKGIRNAIIGVKNGFDNLGIQPLTTLFGALKFVVTALWDALNGIFGIFKGAAASVDWSWLEGPKEFIKNILTTLNDYGKGLISFEDVIKRIKDSFGGITNVLSNVFNAIKDFVVGLFSNFNLAKNTSNDLADNINNSGRSIRNAVLNTINFIKEKFSGVTNFIGNAFSKISSFFGGINLPFKDLGKNISLVVAGLGVSGLVITKFVKNIKKISILSNINSLIQAGTNVLVAYQKQAQSKTILNIAISIGILAGAMLVLSLVPYDKLENGLIIFSSFLGVVALTVPVVINSITRFRNSLTDFYTSISPINNLINQLGKFGKKMARGFRYKMLGDMFKNIALSILILVGAMIALKIVFKKPEDIIFPLAAIAGMVILVTGAVAGLVILIERLGKSASRVKPSVAIFQEFFKLSGVAKIIKAIAASMLMLSISLLIISKIPKKDFGRTILAFVVVFGMLSGLMITITALSRNSGSVGKIKKITLSITGALLAVAVILGMLALIGDTDKMAVAVLGINGILLSMALILKTIGNMKIPKNISSLIGLFATVSGSLIAIVASIGILVAIIDKSGSDSWKAALISLGVLFSLFAGSTIALLEVAKHIGGKTTVWSKLQATIAIMSGAILSIAAATYVIGKTDPIPPSVFVLLTGFAAVVAGIVAIAAIIAAKGAAFSKAFVKTVMSIGIVISAMATAFALTLMGIASLVKAFNEINVSSDDIGETTKKVADKIAAVGTMILTLIPQIADMFGKIGYAVGSAVIEFIEAFVDRIVSLGSRLFTVVEKLVNIILDVLETVVEALYNRKDQIASIIKKALDLIVVVTTAVINQIFRKGKTQLSEADVSKWLGFGAITLAIIKFSGGIINVFKGLKTVATSIYNFIVKTVGGIAKKVKEGVAAAKAAEAATKASEAASSATTVAAEGAKKAAKEAGASAGGAAAKTGGGLAGVASSLWSVFAVVTAVVGAVAAAGSAVTGVMQLMGKMDAYHDASITKVSQVFTNFKALGQSLIYGFAYVGRVIVQVFMTVVRVIVGAITGAIYLVVKAFTSARDWILKNIFRYSDQQIEVLYGQSNKYIDALGETSKQMFSDIAEGWKNVGNFEIGQNDWEIKANDAKKGSKEVGEAITDGAAEGLNDYYDTINGRLDKDNAKVIQNVKDQYGIHSPSTVFCDIYKNVMLGAVKGLKKSSSVYKNAVKKINKDSINAAKNTAQSLEKIMNQLGLTQVDVARKLSFNIKDESTGLEQTVILRREIVETIEKEAEALKGKTKEEAAAYLWEKMNTEEMQKQYGHTTQANVDAALQALFSFQDNSTKITQQGLDNLSYNTKATIQELVGADTAANNLIATDAYQRYTEIEKLAEEHKDEIVGKKKDEVKQILYQAALEQGMSEEGAKEAVDAVVDEMFKGKKAKQKISAKELEEKLRSYKTDIDSFESLETFKTALANKNAEIRDKIAKEESSKKIALAGIEAKKLAEIEAGTWSYQKEKDYQEQAYNISKPYDKRINNYKQELKNWTDMYTDKVEKQLKQVQKDLKISDKELKKRQKEAKNMLNSNKTNNRGKFSSIWDMFKSALGRSAGDIDKNPWNQKNDNDGSGKGKDKDKDAINKAKDTKKKLEDQRADLTPTFDLDKLASEASKANGIVMSSLMAAQNASIGDYINKDSELNPFMKDRWQNVYNFTQNNYSPKALSRIDIYRQTERQISMSRGF